MTRDIGEAPARSRQSIKSKNLYVTPTAVAVEEISVVTRGASNEAAALVRPAPTRNQTASRLILGISLRALKGVRQIGAGCVCGHAERFTFTRKTASDFDVENSLVAP